MKLKSLLIIFIAILANTSLQAQSPARSLAIGTFNIRYDNKADTGNLWVNRAPVVANLIRFHEFDVLGVQEALINQLNDISTALPEYSRAGVGREDGKEGGEHSAIYFLKDRFKLLKKGDFWLSETPDKPGKGWDVTCCNRICSWVFLQDLQTKKSFYVFNAHFDHQAVIARKESAKLILKKITEIAGTAPVIFTGDLNGPRTSEWYLTLANSNLIKDAYIGVKHPYENNSSSNGFRTPKGMGVIDHIFITKLFSPSKWGILTDTYFGKYPSDHFPVKAVLELK